MADDGALAERRGRLADRSPDGTLRTYAGQGVMVNAAFSVALQGISLLRGFLVAAFLAPGDYGVWAIIVVGYAALGRLKQVGIVDKYIQQDDPDEEVAFQKAFTLETILSGGFWVLLMVATPLIALVYRAPEIIGPGIVALLAVPGAILQTPVWAYQRDMDFKQQRKLTVVDPVVASIVTVVLAIAGARYWSFAVGNVVGATAGAAMVLRHAPYRLRFRYDRGTARQYVTFSTPILLSNLGNLILLQGTLLAARSAVGVAGIGALSLASSVRNYTEFADRILSNTMYPAVCAVKDRRDLLVESFVKSNRLALMWGFPAGMGMVLFAGDLVRYLLGEEWVFATVLFQLVGAVSAIGHIAFNWDSYIRALGDTRPIAKYAWIGLAGWAVAPMPLIFLDGLRGYGTGLLIVSLLNLVVRGHYARQLFPGFRIIRHTLRALVPTLPALAAVLAARLVEPDERTLLVTLGELVLYAGVTALVTWAQEGPLLREAFGYLRRARARRVEVAA